MTRTTTGARPAPRDGICAYVFTGTSNRCGAEAAHPVHRGRWRGPEENHDFNHAHRFLCACGEERR